MRYLYGVVLVLFCAPSLATEPAADVIGNAYSADDGSLLYTEHHYYSDDKLDHRVVYFDAQGKALAVKQVDYRSGFVTPEFTQSHNLYDELVVVQWQGNDLQMSYRPGSSDETTTSLVEASSPLVIDAGFDHFIRQNWQSLLAGDSVKFNYAAPSRMSLIGLTAEAQPCEKDSAQHRCFAIKPQSWIVALFLDPLQLTYNNQHRRISRFKGIANIIDENGKALNVDIQYSYRDIDK